MTYATSSGVAASTLQSCAVWGLILPGKFARFFGWRQVMELLAPVAEYRGVALIERRGDKRTVWKGKQYPTDGGIYLWKRCDALKDGQHRHGRRRHGEILLVRMPGVPGMTPDAVAKHYLDSLTQEECRGYLSFLEVLRRLRDEKMASDFQRRMDAGLRWEWDDSAHVFVQSPESEVR